MDKRFKLNIGLIGTGRLGALYAEYIATRIPKANLYAVAGHRAFELEAQYPTIVHASIDRKEVINDPLVDTIMICSSTDTHVEFIREAFKTGKPVFCEKPLSLDLDSAIALKTEQKDTFFQMGFMRRFDRHYAEGKITLDLGIIGEPVLFKSTSRDKTRTSIEYAKTSGGLIMDMGIHDIDLARWFCGEIESIDAVGACLVFPELNEVNDIDNAILTLKFKSGALGLIDISRNAHYGYDVNTEILGSKDGAIRIGSLRDTHVQILAGYQTARTGVEYTNIIPSFMERFEDAFIRQLRNFVDNVSGEKESPVTLNDGIEAIRWASIAKQKMQEKL